MCSLTKQAFRVAAPVSFGGSRADAALAYGAGCVFQGYEFRPRRTKRPRNAHLRVKEEMFHAVDEILSFLEWIVSRGH
jgi:hypothetical protein